MGTGAPLATSGRRSERLAAVLSALDAQHAVTVEELATTLGVSASTVRRDLGVLGDRGLLDRTHGGARRQPGCDEVPVQLRQQRARDAKRRIAARAAELVPSGPHALALTGGTTTLEIARMLRRRTELTIVTNSLAIATDVATSAAGKLIITGGYVRPTSLEAVGVLAENAYKAMNLGTAIVGADGFSADGGVTTYDEVEARASNAMVHAAQRVIVVADGSKVGQVKFAQMAPTELVDVLITDATADADEVDRLRRIGVVVEVVPGPR